MTSGIINLATTTTRPKQLLLTSNNSKLKVKKKKNTINMVIKLNKVEWTRCSWIILQKFLKENRSIWGQCIWLSERKEEQHGSNSRLACSSNRYCQNHESEKPNHSKKRANDKNQNRQCKAIKLVFLLQQTQDMIRLTWWKESKL